MTPAEIGFVNYPRAQTLLWKLEKTLRQPQPPHLLLYGPPNNGTTSLLCRFSALHPPSEDPERRTQPVIYIAAPPGLGEERLYKTILRVIQAPGPSHKPAVGAAEQASYVLRAIGCRVLIVDDINHLRRALAAANGKGLRLLLEFAARAELSLILAGCVTSDQAAREFSMFERHELPRWNLDPDFADLVERLSEAAGLTILPTDRSAVLAHLHRRTDGVLGAIMEIFQLCAKELPTRRLTPDALASIDWQRPSQRWQPDIC